MPKNQLEFHSKKENQNDCYQHCHKGQRNDKIRTCISPFAFRCLGASCLDHVALVGVQCRLGLHLCSTVEIHLRCRGTAVNCDAVLLSRLNTVACVAITRFARLVQHQERCTALSVSWVTVTAISACRAVQERSHRLGRKEATMKRKTINPIAVKKIMNAVVSMNSLVQSAVISVGLSPLGVNPYEQRGHLLLAEKINQVSNIVNSPTQS